MARKLKKPREVNTNEWMNTYADTVTLLLCFFVLLFSFSTINETKWKEIVESFSIQGLVAGDSNKPVSSVPNIPEVVPTKSTPEDELYNTIKKYLEGNDLTSKVELVRGDGKISIRFKDTILFDPDKTALREDGKVILGNICEILNQSISLIDLIEIQGHTAANATGAPQFINTFEFSSERALHVLRYTLDVKKLSPYKLCALGFGQYHPVATNETEEGRVENRRVEIVVISTEAARIVSNVNASGTSSLTSSGK